MSHTSPLEFFWCKARDNLNRIGKHRTRNFWLFESSVWFHMFANSLISIYLPILMLDAGFELSAILLMYVIFHVVNTPINYLAQYLIKAIGARRTIIIGTFFQMLFFILYATIHPGDWTTLIALGVVAAIYDALYYTAAMYLFMRSTVDIKNNGSNTGILYAVIRSASLIGPFAGSAILLLTGSSLWVIIAVLVAFACSVSPLFFADLEGGTRSEIMPLRKFFALKYVTANHISLGLYKVHESVNSILWPVFIYLYFGTLESVALIAVMVPVVALIFSYFTGKIGIHYRYYVIALGATLMSLVWLGRIFIENDIWYYASVVLAGLFVLFMQVPVDANIFRSGSESNPLTASAAKNIVSMGTKSILFIVLYIASITFTSSFAIAGVAMAILIIVNLIRLWYKYHPISNQGVAKV